MSVRVFQILSICSLTALFAGCGGSLPSPQDMAKYSSQALGIPVFVWAQSDDACVVKQLKSFYDEYTKAKENERKRLVEKFKAYSAVIVQVSENIGTFRRSTLQLNMFENDCHKETRALRLNRGANICNLESVGFMVWSDEQTLMPRRYPGTRVELGGDNDGSPRVLYITPTVANDLSSQRIYSTSKPGILADVEKNSSANLDADIKKNLLTFVSVKMAEPINCGKLATFADLFQAK